MLTAPIRSPWLVSLVGVLGLAACARAQLPPELVEESVRLGAALQPVLLELDDPQYVFDLPATVRIIHVTVERLRFSTAAIQVLDEWTRQPGHVLWVDIATSADLFGLPAGPAQSGAGGDIEGLELALPTDGHPLLEGVTCVTSYGWVLYDLPPEATPILWQGDGVACAVYPYGEGTVIFLPPLTDHPSGTGFPPGILDNDRFVLNLGRWLCGLTGAAVPARPSPFAGAGAAAAPSDPTGWVTCPCCGFRFARDPVTSTALPETPSVRP